MSDLDPAHAANLPTIWNKLSFRAVDLYLDDTKVEFAGANYDTVFLPSFQQAIDDPNIGILRVDGMIDYLKTLVNGPMNILKITIHFQTDPKGTVDVERSDGSRDDSKELHRLRGPGRGLVKFFDDKSFAVAGMRTFAPGLSIGVSGQTSYTMQYVNGAQTYFERFALLRFEAFYVAAAGGSVAAAIGSASGAMAAVPVIGTALAALVDLAAAWYAHASIDADGSLTADLAYHYCGTHAGGMDITAWPLPGIDPARWRQTVDGLIAFAQTG